MILTYVYCLTALQNVLAVALCFNCVIKCGTMYWYFGRIMLNILHDITFVTSCTIQHLLQLAPL